MKINKRTLGTLAGVLVLLALSVSTVFADSTTWKLSSFNASGRALRAQTADVGANGTVSFTFPKTADAAYLVTAKSGGGDRTGGTLSATVGVVTTGTTTFAAYPDGCNPSGADPKVGLYFQTQTVGGFNPSDYWWSSERVLVDGLVNTPTLLTRGLALGNWSDWDGHLNTFDAAHEASFAAAVANVTSWGVSFGGGCHYANGVGTPTGSAVFSLTPSP